ncbi:LOW QUALITY PROTEIN: hypothetical protein M8C21_028824, partial [Ambrosia artemisiifolia]
MSNSIMLFFVLSFFYISSTSSSSINTTHKCSVHQTHALLLFKQNLSSDTFYVINYFCEVWLGSGYKPIMMNWNTSTDCCDWNGVTCDHSTGDVIGLDLSCGVLYDIGRLSNSLTHLNISHCGFTGQVPTDISHLHKLVSLDLSWNDFNLEPHVFINLLQNLTVMEQLSLTHVNISSVLHTNLNISSSSLKLLNLQGTGLQGNLPHNIFSLQSLEKLDLSFNSLTGHIPSEILLLPKLVSLHLSSNGIDNLLIQPHIVRTLLTNSTFLRDLWLHRVNIGLVLPTYLNITSSLRSLDLTSTNLQGKLPDNIFNLEYLEELVLLENSNLSGPLPKVNTSMGIPLRQLYLSGTSLSGEIPTSIGHLTSLEDLALSNCGLNGSLPKSLGNLKYLDYLSLSNNMFQGNMPLELFSLQSLETLSLDNNQLTGQIDVLDNGPNLQTFQRLTNLTKLDLSYNNFRGDWELDALLSSLPNLYTLILSHSGISVTTSNASNHYVNPTLSRLGLASCSLKVFPVFIRAMTNLRLLDLSNNAIQGHIPNWVGEIGRNQLSVLNLANNSLTGTIPNVYEDWSWLQGFILNGNQLEGKVPTSLNKCQFLTVLVLRSNNFHGAIVTSSKVEFPFQRLQVLDLSHNGFVGQLPTNYFQNFSAMKSVVRDNRKPKYFNTFDEYSFGGNPKLCGLPLSKKCGEHLQKPQLEGDGDGEEENVFTWKVVVMGYGCGALLGIVLGYLMLSTRRPKLAYDLEEAKQEKIIELGKELWGSSRTLINHAVVDNPLNYGENEKCRNGKKTCKDIKACEKRDHAVCSGHDDDCVHRVPSFLWTTARKGGAMWVRAMWVKYLDSDMMVANRTVVMPFNAPIPTNNLAQFIPTASNAIPIGISLPGFLVSSPNVATPSNPTYAKNIKDEAFKIPGKPKGAKGSKLARLAFVAPTIIMANEPPATGRSTANSVQQMTESRAAQPEISTHDSPDTKPDEIKPVKAPLHLKRVDVNVAFVVDFMDMWTNCLVQLHTEFPSRFTKPNNSELCSQIGYKPDRQRPKAPRRNFSIAEHFLIVVTARIPGIVTCYPLDLTCPFLQVACCQWKTNQIISSVCPYDVDASSNEDSLRWTDLNLEPHVFINLLQNSTVMKQLSLAYVDIFAVLPTNLNIYSPLTLLNLEYTGLQGNLPHNIFNLQSLEILDLSDNNLMGHTPSENSLLPKLVSLDLSKNGNLRIQPRILSIILQNSTFLRDLTLTWVYIGSALPTYLNTSSLRSLDLSSTSLQGKLPDNIFNLEYLEELYLSRNSNLSGAFPMVNTSSSIPLKGLDLSRTSLSGEIPTSIGHLTSLFYLDLSNCRLNGSLPKSLGNLRHLKYLYLSNNMFQGNMPLELFSLQSLTYLSLSNNQLTDRIDVLDDGPGLQTFERLTNLSYIDLSHNNFRGDWELDALLSTLPNLHTLILSHSGISVTTSNASNHYVNPALSRLSLASCSLKVFPVFIRAMTNLIQLDLSNNDIQGPIPEWIGEIGRNHLSVLNLANNSLCGTIPNVCKDWSELEGYRSCRHSFSIISSFNFTIVDLHLDILLRCIIRSMQSHKNYVSKAAVHPMNLKKDAPSIDPIMYKFNAMLLVGSHGTNVGDSVNRDWNTSTDCCDWNGVTCDHSTGDVIGLDLSCGMLQGTIHPNTTLFHLPHLQRLNLASNDFNNSQLPAEIGRLSNSLTHLNISRCRFSRKVPTDISHLHKLVSLDLSSNWNGTDYLKLEPHVFINLLQNSTVMKQLSLSFVNIPSVLPTNLNISPSLKLLNLRYTGLQGNLPHNIFSLQSLEKLDLSSNSLTGHIPSEISLLPKLVSLDLSFNGIDNLLIQPHIFRTLLTNSTILRYLWLDEVNIGLVLPSYLNISSSLRSLYLRDTSLQGKLPDNILNLEYLEVLDLSVNNNLSGPFSKVNTSSSIPLRGLDLSGTSISGEIPTSIGHLKSLEYLSLSYCGFNGSLPKSLGNLKYLEILYLSNNMFQGNMPLELFSLQSLIRLSLDNNQLTGQIGDWELDALLSSLPNLDTLTLSHSGISVTPSNASKHYVNPGLQVLSLASCSLKVFPVSIRAMTNLYNLDLSNNAIQGHIPDWVGEIGRKQLLFLNLANNSLTGTIPNVYKDWSRLQGFVLNGNQLEGKVPTSLSKCQSLRVLVLDQNKQFSWCHFSFFQGQLPTNYYQNFNAMKNVVRDNRNQN